MTHTIYAAHMERQVRLPLAPAAYSSAPDESAELLPGVRHLLSLRQQAYLEVARMSEPVEHLREDEMIIDVVPMIDH